MTETLGIRTAPAPPVRIVHIGLGAFHRSHQAWYTAAARDAGEWGIAAYAGRSSALAEALTAQDGLYTLVVRSPDGDRAERVDSVVRAHAGADVNRLVADLAAPTTAIVTLTITEAAYADARSAADRDLLAEVDRRHDLEGLSPVTAIGRLALGLEARRRRGAPALAVVSCDNLPDNGGALARALSNVVASPVLADWISEKVSFVSSSVDRITPRLSTADARELSDRHADRAPVVTEPFSDWVLEGTFPAGRPHWESAGARVVDDLEPWEARKLWLLNGAHTLLASLGRQRGHTTVSEAIADGDCRRAVEAFWDEACRHLPERLELEAYRAALLDRFANPRIVHLLEQITLDSDTKVRLRIVPVAERERRAGRSGAASAAALAAWVISNGAADDREQIRRAVIAVSPALGGDESFVDTVVDSRNAFRAPAPG